MSRSHDVAGTISRATRALAAVTPVTMSCLLRTAPPPRHRRATDAAGTPLTLPQAFKKGNVAWNWRPAEIGARCLLLRSCWFWTRQVVFVIYRKEVSVASKETGQTKCSNQTIFFHESTKIVVVLTPYYMIYSGSTRSFHSPANSKLTIGGIGILLFLKSNVPPNVTHFIIVLS